MRHTSKWRLAIGLLTAALCCRAVNAATSHEASANSAPATKDGWRAAPLGTPPLNAGQTANRWRYRFFEGRWWYWMPDNQWSYFNGRRWSPYRPGEYQSKKVDPALLRIEAREGVAGSRRWPRAASSMSSGAMTMSGTQGTLGGAPSGSFTSPAGVPSAMNSSTGTTTGVSGLNSAGTSPGASMGLGRAWNGGTRGAGR